MNMIIDVLRDLGLIKLHMKAWPLGTNISVLLIFGIGFGTLGYCPGTSVGAVIVPVVALIVLFLIGLETIGQGVFAP